MSVLTRQRLSLAVIATLLAATAALANNPSPRSEVRMVYNPATTNSILFGGRGATDYGTATAYFSNETWIWNGSRWAQRFPPHAPSARAGYGMAFDTVQSRVVLFGGRNSDKSTFDDTWVYSEHDNDWTELFPATAPSTRQGVGMAYDPLRNRVLLVGGSHIATDGVTFDPLYDTWEFDGVNWKQVVADGPKVIKPIITWDGARSQMVMLGVDSAAKPVMYTYDTVGVQWKQVTPKDLPPCTNEATLTYMEEEGLLALVGGACAGVNYDQAYYYDGTNWAPFGGITGPGYVFANALDFDIRRHEIVLFGGLERSQIRALTFTYSGGDWHLRGEIIRPEPRASVSFATDPINQAIWLFGGLNQYGDAYYDDLWKYQNGNWALIQADGNPSNCGSPASAVDTERAKLVVACNGSSTYEFDLKDFTWKTFSGLKESPPVRRLAQLVYDPQLKKTVLFGGFDDLNYRNDTWLWDGTAWTEVKKNRADARTGAAMWFDPTLKKVVMYGGIGRPAPENTIRRYSDMWSLDGTNGWTKMDVKTTPGELYDARVLLDPHTNTIKLFGGIRIDEIDSKTRKQVISADSWEWNGTTWTKISAGNVPGPRQAFGLGFDGYANRFVLFGGYNGLYLSDVWTSPDWKAWTPREELLERRRVIRK